MLSVVVPLYRNEESLPALLEALSSLSESVRRDQQESCEVVFVIDGSPDRCELLLRERLAAMPFPSKLVTHSRNFGAFAAVRTGLAAGGGDYHAVMAADLQEPPELPARFLEVLKSGEVDVVVGQREGGRADPWSSRLASSVFWILYRRLVMSDIPPGGVDVFGCTRRVRDLLLTLNEANSSLIGQLFWLGFRRRTVSYARRQRRHGRSAWSSTRRLRYLADSVFSFTDLPIRILIALGIGGVALAAVLTSIVLLSRLAGNISVPGYTATVITVLFFGALNCLGLGMVGTYAWRAFENTKSRPLAVVASETSFAGTSAPE
jgi:glycosyltransferase involved in cell wall biosynthesis